jgi:hypothetical protein
MGKDVQVSFLQEQLLGIDGVKFIAIVGGHRVPCEVLSDALDNHFKAETEGNLNAFLKHRRQIEAKARELIEQQKYQPDGSILIGTSDIGTETRSA